MNGCTIGKLPLLAGTLYLQMVVRLVAQPAFPDSIAFITTPQHNIVLPAVINRTDTLMLMFHSSYRGVSLTEEGLGKCRTVDLDGLGTALSWGGANDSPVSSVNRIQIGTSTWDSMMITIDANSGPGSDGKFGYDLFANKVVEVDRGGGWFILHDHLPKNSVGYEALPLADKDNGLFVDASLTLSNNSITDRFMVHTGFGGSCIVGADLHAALPAGIVLDTLGIQELQDSFGHVLRNVVTCADLFKFGQSEMLDLPIQLMDKRSHFGHNVLGNDILRRSDLLFDLKNDRLFVRPNATSSR
ncbi:MAG TPA: hypothetical protein PKJ19_15810 [Flavobacteriales bacterium]|nr:hypothetical protein [Flavobacteriales bacterium]HNU58286.1 hypothetical protein [Flavobacteriales bacterium]